MARTKTVTVTTSAQDVTITGRWEVLEVTNLDGAGIVYARADGTTAVAAADDTDAIPAAAGAFINIDDAVRSEDTTRVVSLIATASTVVQVRGIS